MADFSNMDINNIQPIKPIEIDISKGTDKVEGVSFKDVLQSSMDEIKDMNEKADKALEQLVTGEVQDMHQVMLAIEKADLTFKTMMQIRNKLLDAYQEVMRMRF